MVTSVFPLKQGSRAVRHPLPDSHPSSYFFLPYKIGVVGLFMVDMQVVAVLSNYWGHCTVHVHLG